MARVGYARVSSVGQSLVVQLDKLHHCDKLFQETTSGVGSRRPQLAACLEYVRDGDTLVVTRLDRRARSTLHLCQIAAGLHRKQVQLQVLDQHIDTSDATGRLLFHMLGAIAQFETELRAERQMDGIRKARERGVHLGRTKRLTSQQRATLRQQRAQGVLIKTLMREYSLSKASVYRYLSETEAGRSTPQCQTV
jgi:DNA invertase Pin-like site-specific DNA recombinase